MRITCKQYLDKNGFGYGRKNDFCGSELEIEGSDIKKHYHFKYPDHQGTSYGVICPVCGQFVEIDSNILPMKIKNEAKEISINNNKGEKHERMGKLRR